MEDQLDPVFLAMSKLRRGMYDECIEICTNLLAENPKDKAVWFLKTRALTLSDYIDDTEMEEEGIADMMMDENALAEVARPGTSLSRPQTQSSSNKMMRPMSSSGRPLTGLQGREREVRLEAILEQALTAAAVVVIDRARLACHCIGAAGPFRYGVDDLRSGRTFY